MVCQKCGAQLMDGATFCPVCGAAVTPQNSQYYATQGPASGGMNNQNDNSNRGLIILVGSIAAAIVFVIVAIITFMFMSGSSPFGAKETPTPIPTATPTPTPEPTPIPEPTPQIVYVPVEQSQPQSQPVQAAGGYKTYYSSEYGFSCDYPANFTVYDDGGTLTLYTVRSPDGAGVEKIVATPNNGETVSSSSSAYLASHPGEVTYRSVGDDYYAFSVRNGSRESYRYCKFAKGNIYWFDFEYPMSQYDLYDKYINDVYRSFSF